MSVFRGEVADAPIRILSSVTRQHLATRLDSRKILLVSRGVHRDWRGLAEQASLDVSSISCWGKISPTEHCLHIWGQKGGTVMQLWTFLESMDRFDVIDDTLEMIYSDYDKCMSQGGGALAALPPPLEQLVTDVSTYDRNILTVDDHRNLSMGLGLQYYAALVLFADEDIDFVQEMVEKLEGEYGLKLCLKDRDLVGGLQFESDSIVRLIIERCTRVIVVLSPEFLASSANNFFILFAHALSVDQRRRIVIPCLHKPCTKPAIINFCHSLDYYRAKGYWNYWEKLRDSLIYQPQISSSEPRARIREVSGSSTSSQVSASSLNITTPSPSQSPSFFSKFLWRSDVKGKMRTASTSLEDSSETGKTSFSENEDSHIETDSQKSLRSTNGYPWNADIRIRETPAGPVLHLNASAASGESSDYTGIFQRLPDVPETCCTSPMSTSSSAALLLPEESTSNLQSSSRFFKRIFKGKQKKHKVPG
nr:myeloid differentiation primary response protein MyD88-like [Procambarus clarkii]